MKVVLAPRASTIIYGLLVAQDPSCVWLMPANVCPIVPLTFLKAGVPFEFVDIAPETFEMDRAQVEELVKRRRVGGVLYLHPYGELSTPQDFFRSIKRTSAEPTIVDDRCLCVPDLDFDDESVADVILYSTGYAKVVDMGHGGYAFIKDSINFTPPHLAYSPAQLESLEKNYKRAVSDRQYFNYTDTDWLETDSSRPPGWDEYRMRIKSGLELSLTHRRVINDIYTARLPGEIRLAEGFQTWRFNVRVKNQQETLRAIFGAGLFASAHYAPLSRIFSHGGRAPVAEGLAAEVINLFNDHHFNEQQATAACDLILENL